MATPTILDTYVQRAPGSSSSDSTTFTVSAGNNKLLVVMFFSPSGGPMTSATYNGVSLTVRNFTIAQYYVAWAYLVNPPEGAHTLVVNYPSQTEPCYRTFTMKDIDQATPYDVDGNANGSSGNASKTLTTTKTNCKIISFSCISRASTGSVVSGQTAEWSSDSPYSTRYWGGGSQDTTTTGNYTSTFTQATNDGWEQLAIAFNYGAPTINTTNFFNFF